MLNCPSSLRVQPIKKPHGRKEGGATVFIIYLATSNSSCYPSPTSLPLPKFPFYAKVTFQAAKSFFCRNAKDCPVLIPGLTTQYCLFTPLQVSTLIIPLLHVVTSRKIQIPHLFFFLFHIILYNARSPTYTS